MQLRFILLIVISFFLQSCNSGSEKGKDSEKEDDGKSLTLEGTISFIGSQFSIGAAVASEITCKSVCNRQTQHCAALFKLASNPSDKDEKICDTIIHENGTYKFEIEDKQALEDEALLIKVDNFKGNKREAVVVVESGLIQKNIDSISTASATSVKETLKNSGRISNSEVENEKNLLQNELILMCPLVITPSNVNFVIRNTINILSRDRSVPLFLQHRNLLRDSLSLDPIRNDLDNYCALVLSIIGSQNSNNLKIRLVDKKGNPYSNMQMYIGQNDINGSIYTTSGNGVFRTTDADGFFDVSGLSYGGRSLIIGDYSWYSENFLWTEDEKYIGYFYYDQNLFYQEIVFPKVIKQENITTTYEQNASAGYKYIAQSIQVSSPIELCGIGFGIGLGNIGRPEKFQIRSDNNGSPSSSFLYENKVYGFTGALSQGGEAPFSNFCNAYTNVQLQTGTYWIVAAFSTVPEKSYTIGRNQLPTSGLSIMASQDGASWSSTSMGAIQAIWVFITE